MSDTLVVLALAVLPLTGGSALDRGALAAQAGCAPATAVITVAEDPERGWLALVRCRVPVVPTADILRADPWDASRQVRGACMNPGPFSGCAGG